MASRRTVIRPVRVLALVATVFVGLVLLPATSGTAAAPPTAAEARRQAAALQHKMEKATEEFDMARVLLARSQVREKALRRQAAAQRVKVTAYEAEVAEFAASAYRGGRIDMVTSLLSSGSPQIFLDQMSTLDNLSRTQRAQLTRLIAAKRVLDAQQKSINKAITEQRQNQATLQTRKAAIGKDLAKWSLLDAQLTPRASRGVRAPIGAIYTGPATGNARKALDMAYAQMGKPYQWGADGPNSYDCSGLTQVAWRAGGVSLPHSSRMQYSSVPRKVARGSLQPGDLVFFGAPISHVAIFVSGDTAIGAPTTGDVVRYQSISRMGKPYAGAVRP